jgi:hypothetical protein
MLWVNVRGFGRRLEIPKQALEGLFVRVVILPLAEVTDVTSPVDSLAAECPVLPPPNALATRTNLFGCWGAAEHKSRLRDNSSHYIKLRSVL